MKKMKVVVGQGESKMICTKTHTHTQYTAMARLGLYQLSLASPEFLPLLKFAIRADTFVDSCVLILLDWTRPWKFVETLERWINVLHYLTDEICKEGTAADTNWSKGRAVVDEIKEKRKPTHPHAAASCSQCHHM